jgi:hypothetical protein
MTRRAKQPARYQTGLSVHGGERTIPACRKTLKPLTTGTWNASPLEVLARPTATQLGAGPANPIPATNSFEPRVDVLPPSQLALWPTEARDYLGVYALLKSGIPLAKGLRFAKQVYGPDFNTLLPLQALCYFQEPSLRDLPEPIKTRLVKAVQSVR